MVAAGALGRARDLTDDERRWLLALLIVADRGARRGHRRSVRVDRSRPGAVRQFLRRRGILHPRSIWLRNVALGLPIHSADLIYAFDEYSADQLSLRARVRAGAGRTVAVRRASARRRLLPGRRGHPVSAARRASFGRDAAAASALPLVLLPAEPVRVVDLRAEGAAVLSADRRRSRAGSRSRLSRARSAGAGIAVAAVIVVRLRAVLSRSVRQGGADHRGHRRRRRHRCSAAGDSARGC